LPWLAPDWVLDLTGDPVTGGPKLTRGRLRRGELRLAVRRAPQSLWPRFARHHYLSGGLATSATCYAAFWEGVSGLKFQTSSSKSDLKPETWNLKHSVDSPQPSSLPVAFCAVVATLGWKGRKRITRLVVLPEWQGLGIGPRLAERVAACEHSKGFHVSITASHPAIVGHMSRSPRWRYTGLKKTGSTRQRLGERAIRCSTGRAVASFEWVGDGERGASASR
jgi:GNAT superfamily N-acetyltransferase